MTLNNGDDVRLQRRGLSTFTLFGRAPYQGPRRRELAPADLEHFRRWLSAELRLSALAVIEAVEWVAFDSRETPHTTMVSVRDGQWQFAFTVGKPLDKIVSPDLPPAVREAQAAAERRAALAAMPLIERAPVAVVGAHLRSTHEAGRSAGARGRG
jgi:hypothetical protein